MIVTKISKNYPNFNLKVDFSMKNEIFTLFGKSGNGKSLTLNIIAGFIQPEKGSFIKIDDEIILDEKINVKIENRKIGYVTQQSYLFPHYNVEKNLLFAYEEKNKNNYLFKDIVNILNIENLLLRYPQNLSGGEKQKVALGRALLSQPKILLLDEPISSIDIQNKWIILEYIRKIHNFYKIPIVFVTHSFEEMEYLSDSIAIIEKGEIIEKDIKTNILNSNYFLKNKKSLNYINFFKVKILEHLPNEEITKVKIANKIFTIPYTNKNINEEIEIFIESKSIIIAKDHPNDLSVRNIYCGKVIDIIEIGNFILLKINDGSFELVAEITKLSLKEMNICKGDTLHYIIKTYEIKTF